MQYILPPACVVVVIGLAQNVLSEPLTYSEVIKNAEKVVGELMKIYAGPPHRPQPDVELRSPEALAWSTEVRAKRLGALIEMDDAVIEMIMDGLHRRKTLGKIRERTESWISWSEWPNVFDTRQDALPGIRDWQLSEEAWTSPENAVHVLYDTYQSRDGKEYIFIQATYRNRIRRQYPRPRFSAYTLSRKGATWVMTTLYHEVNEVGPHLLHSAVGACKTLLGFVEDQEFGHSGVLMYSGPSGNADVIQVYFYLWDGQSKGWQEIHLMTLDSARKVAYNSETTVLRCFRMPNSKEPTFEGSLRDVIVSNREVIIKETLQRKEMKRSFSPR